MWVPLPEQHTELGRETLEANASTDDLGNPIPGYVNADPIRGRLYYQSGKTLTDKGVVVEEGWRCVTASHVKVRDRLTSAVHGTFEVDAVVPYTVPGGTATHHYQLRLTQVTLPVPGDN